MASFLRALQISSNPAEAARLLALEREKQKTGAGGPGLSPVLHPVAGSAPKSLRALRAFCYCPGSPGPRLFFLPGFSALAGARP